mgnify:FL=1
MIKEQEYPLPSVHMNGTGKQTLLSDYEKVADNLDDLLKAFEKMNFHPRDYYVDGGDAFSEAMKERGSHAIALNKFSLYLKTHLPHLNKQ